MGSQIIQAKLWGQQAKDWADIQEGTGKAGYDFALNKISFTPATRLLDIGCGTGYFCDLAYNKGFRNITGLDATSEFIKEAKKRSPTANFTIGEMEELPFKDESFDVVCGFNSFQYAADIKNALTEAKRVLVRDGKLVAMIWGNKEDCEAATYLKAVGSLLPPPPPGAAGPFALSENNLVEKLLKEVGLKTISVTDVTAVWDYPNIDIALRGLMSAGPAAKAVENSGFKKVQETLLMAVRPYLKSNGHVVYHNKFRVAIAQK